MKLMDKKYMLIATALCLSLLVSLTSAYTYYYPEHSYYGSGLLSYFDRNTLRSTTFTENEESVVIDIPGGTKKITTTVTQKTTVKKNLFPYYSYPYFTDYASTGYGPTYKYSSVYPSNWRFKEPYYSFNTYTTPYYYEPRYDSNLGYYNWRY